MCVCRPWTIILSWKGWLIVVIKKSHSFSHAPSDLVTRVKNCFSAETIEKAIFQLENIPFQKFLFSFQKNLTEIFSPNEPRIRTKRKIWHEQKMVIAGKINTTFLKCSSLSSMRKKSYTARGGKSPVRPRWKKFNRIKLPFDIMRFSKVLEFSIIFEMNGLDFRSLFFSPSPLLCQRPFGFYDKFYLLLGLFFVWKSRLTSRKGLNYWIGNRPCDGLHFFGIIIAVTNFHCQRLKKNRTIKY